MAAAEEGQAQAAAKRRLRARIKTSLPRRNAPASLRGTEQVRCRRPRRQGRTREGPESRTPLRPLPLLLLLSLLLLLLLLSLSLPLLLLLLLMLAAAMPWPA